MDKDIEEKKTVRFGNVITVASLQREKMADEGDTDPADGDNEDRSDEERSIYENQQLGQSHQDSKKGHHAFDDFEEYIGIPKPQINQGTSLLEDQADDTEYNSTTITSFNLDEELETGYFDKFGNYIEKGSNNNNNNNKRKGKAREGDVEDSSDDEDNNKAKRKRKSQESDDSDSSSSFDEFDREASSFPDQASEPAPSKDRIAAALKTLIQHLNAKETVQDCIRRLGAKNPPVQKSNGTSQPGNSKATPSEAMKKVMDAADFLVNEADEYDTYLFNAGKLRQLLKKLEPSGSFEAGARECDGASCLYELKWVHDESNTIHGPFDVDIMRAWKDEGYFRASPALVRKPKKGSEFQDAEAFIFE